MQDYVIEETQKDNRIEFVGFLNEQQVSQLLQSADVLLCPSLWEEPFGRVVLDAYKNTLFTTMFRTILSKIFEALTGSVGNLVALESSDRVYKTFRKIWFVNFWLVSFSCAALFALVNPFITLWVGESYLLEERVVFIVCLNLYMRLIRNTFLTFNDTYGMFKQLKPNSLVSMNMWGLTPDFLDVLENGFKEFFEKEVPSNPQKAEYLIPIFIGELLEQGKMSVKVLKTNDTWYGMTYHEDVAAVKGSFKEMLENGVYKADLFADL